MGIHLSSKRSFPVREETGEEREAPAPPPPPPAAEESSYYSSEDEEVPETVSQKVAAPPPVPSQETKPTQRTADTPSSSSEEEEEDEDQVGPIQTAQQMSVVRKSSPEEVSQTVRAQSAPRATSRQIKRPSQNKNELVEGMRLSVTAKEMRKLVSAEAKEQTRGFKRTESREEKKMSFKEKSRWFHGLVKTSQTAA